MELHNNIDDLFYVCRSVYDKGRELGVDTPLLSEKYIAKLSVELI